jgi:hypothetical protein
MVEWTAAHRNFIQSGITCLLCKLTKAAKATAVLGDLNLSTIGTTAFGGVALDGERGLLTDEFTGTEGRLVAFSSRGHG